jgi:hypothetical protein
MDFVEVSLYPTLNGQPAVITVEDEGDGLDPGSVTQLGVRIWKLGSRRAERYPVTPGPEPVPQGEGGARVYRIASLDTTTYDRLAILITRLDAHETADPVGGYRITVDATEHLGD